jgi:hypothetical protein
MDGLLLGDALEDAVAAIDGGHGPGGTGRVAADHII